MKKNGLLLFPMLAIALLLGGTAFAQGDFTFYSVTYYSNANTAGAPDATLRVINDGDLAMNLYADIYVFDDSQEMEECCACVITPDGLLSESVNKQLTANPVTGIKTTRGVVKVLASETSDPTNAVMDPGLHGWMSHIQKLPSGYALTEATLADSNLSPGEQNDLQNACFFVKILGSGQGICSCTPEDFDF